jgi:D-3-phosphoglycerate dehydrogenase
VELVDFATLLRESDVLSIHIHLTEENRHLFRRDTFAQMKPGAVLINTSRGAILEESSLLEALETGHLGGAGLDVVDGEWSVDLRDHPLIRYARNHENLVISPHVGGVTYESQRAAFTFVAERAKARMLELDPAAGAAR